MIMSLLSLPSHIYPLHSLIDRVIQPFQYLPCNCNGMPLVWALTICNYYAFFPNTAVIANLTSVR